MSDIYSRSYEQGEQDGFVGGCYCGAVLGIIGTLLAMVAVTYYFTL